MDFVSYDLLSLGSPFAYLEELERGEKLSEKFDFYKESASVLSSDFEKLVRDGYLPKKKPDQYPLSYVSGKKWYERLKKSANTPAGEHWYTYYHLGVVAYQLKLVDEAKAHFERSNSLCENAWSTRNLALLSLYSKDTKTAAYKMTRAIALCPDCQNLYPDAMKCYLADKQYESAVSCFDNASKNVQNRGRMQLLCAVALISLGEYDRARSYVHPEFKMDDMREGEISLSHVWEDLYCAILREKHPEMSQKELISLQKEIYPLPRHLDFRMHDEDEQGL